MSHVSANPGVEGGEQTDVLLVQQVGETAESQSHIKSRKAPRERARSQTAVFAYLQCAGSYGQEPRTKNQEPNSRQVAFVLRRRDFLAWTAVNYAVLGRQPASPAGRNWRVLPLGVRE